MEKAVQAGLEEAELCRKDIQAEGEAALTYIKKNKIKGIVLAGHPYHIDPEVNHEFRNLLR